MKDTAELCRGLLRKAQTYPSADGFVWGYSSFALINM